MYGYGGECFSSTSFFPVLRSSPLTLLSLPWCCRYRSTKINDVRFGSWGNIIRSFCFRFRLLSIASRRVSLPPSSPSSPSPFSFPFSNRYFTSDKFPYSRDIFAKASKALDVEFVGAVRSSSLLPLSFPLLSPLSLLRSSLFLLLLLSLDASLT